MLLIVLVFSVVLFLLAVFVLVLSLIYSMLPVDCTFLIVPTVSLTFISNIYHYIRIIMYKTLLS